MSSTTIGVPLGESTDKIIALNLSGYRKARIWLGELPQLSYPVVEVLERTLPAKNSEISEVRRAAIEMFVPAGGRFIYGLLAAEFTPENSGQFSVQVAVSANSGDKVNWSLASVLDKVCVGLPIEYSSSVIEEASNKVEILGSGVLRFNRAAHGELGSSCHIFQQLTNISVRLLAYPLGAISEEDFAVIVSAS